MRAQIGAGGPIRVEFPDNGRTVEAVHDLSPRQVEVLLSGGLANWMRGWLAETAHR